MVYRAGEYGVRSREQIEEDIDFLERSFSDSESSGFSPLTAEQRDGLVLRQMELDQRLAPHFEAIEASERLTAEDYGIWIGPVD